MNRILEVNKSVNDFFRPVFWFLLSLTVKFTVGALTLIVFGFFLRLFFVGFGETFPAMVLSTVLTGSLLYVVVRFMTYKKRTVAVA